MPLLNRLAVDTNFLLDLALPKDATHDALETIRECIKAAEIIVPPTVVHEITYMALDGDHEMHQRATKVVQKLVPVWHFTPVNALSEMQEAAAEDIARDLRRKNVLPEAERHDSEILAESAALGCSILVSADSHLCDADKSMVSLMVAAHGAGPIVVCKPAEIVALFAKRR